MSSTRDHRAPRRMLVAVTPSVLGAVLLVGCAVGPPQELAPAEPTARPSVTAPPTSTPAPPTVPDVPVRSADLADLVVEPVVPPTAVALPSIDVAIPVEPVGVRADGQMEIPPQAEVGGWYRFGASPTQEDGTSVIAAHVDSVASAGLGPFARLQDVAVGDPVAVTMADGTTVTFAVTDVRRSPKPEVAWEDVFVDDGTRRLVLVTCGGTFDRGARSYSDNVIVTAEPTET